MILALADHEKPFFINKEVDFQMRRLSQILFFSFTLIVTQISALETDDITLANGGIIIHKQTLKHVDGLSQMFQKGRFTGRLRSNLMVWNWEESVLNRNDDNYAWGIGGSLHYSTAYFNGFSATAGYYSSFVAVDDTDRDNSIGYFDAGKAGKDTYARAYGHGASLNVLAIVFAEYKYEKTSVKFGRQKFESVLLRSNDTKMVPNTFQGLSVDSQGDLKDTRLRVAYFDRQKLRDHRDFHSVIAYGSYRTKDSDGVYVPNRGVGLENDDAASHRGLSVRNIEAAGEKVDPGMLVFTAKNNSVRNLRMDLDTMYIDGFVASVIPEVNYDFFLDNGMRLTPGIRYMRQFDQGAGKIGGASLTGRLGSDKKALPTESASYTDPDSVDGSMVSARLKLFSENGSIMAGFSTVEDAGDLIAPWRGFPTGNYTRSMGQYNWMAGTDSYMIQGYYHFGRAGLLPGVRMVMDVAYMDYDQKKIDAGTVAFTDHSIVHLDVWKTFESIPHLELKLRLGQVFADEYLINGKKVDVGSYGDYRLEANYFF